MKAAEMHCIKVSAAHEHEALGKLLLLSLRDGRPTRFLPHHPWVRDARRVTTRILQEAGGVGHTLAIRAIHDAQLDTPPQVGISICRHVRKKTRTYAVGTWEWRTFSFLAVSRLCSISPSKKVIALYFRSLAAYDGKRDIASLCLFLLGHGRPCRSCYPSHLHDPIVLRADSFMRKRDIQTSFSNSTQHIYQEGIPNAFTASNRFHRKQSLS